MSFASNKTTVTSGTFLFFLCLFPGNMKLKQIRTESNYPLLVVLFFQWLYRSMRRRKRPPLRLSRSPPPPLEALFQLPQLPWWVLGCNCLSAEAVTWNIPASKNHSTLAWLASCTAVLSSRRSAWDIFTSLCWRLSVQSGLWPKLFPAQKYSTQVQMLKMTIYDSESILKVEARIFSKHLDCRTIINMFTV